MQVPPATANARDWRLFQEIAAQADVVLVASRLARECAQGCAQAPPPVDAAAFPDLIAWRKAKGLAPQPEVWVLASGRQPLPAPTLAVWAETRRVRVLAPVRPEGAPDWLPLADMRELRGLLAEAGMRLACFAAGGRLFRRLLAADACDALFLTLRLRVLAGARFATLAEGAALMPPADFRLAGLWRDTGMEQLFLHLERA